MLFQCLDHGLPFITVHTLLILKLMAAALQTELHGSVESSFTRLE